MRGAYGHLLHVRDFEGYFRDGRGCTGHSGRERIGNSNGRPNIFFNDHFAAATNSGGLPFRAEMFNLFNHYNPDPQTVDTNLKSATFGSIGGGVSGITTRVIQLGAN